MAEENLYCPMKASRLDGRCLCQKENCAWWTVYDDVGGSRHERCAIKHLADPTPVTVTLTDMGSYKKKEEDKP